MTQPDVPRAPASPTDAAEPTRSERALEEFGRGFLRPSGASLLGMILFAIAEAALFVLFVTPRNLARLPYVALMTGARDDYARLTMLTFRMRYARGAPLSVVYLGASHAQRALWDSAEPEPMERKLSRAAGEPVSFWSLYAGGETIEESALIVHQLPEHFRGVAVLVVHEDKDDRRSKLIAMRQNAKLEERLPLELPAGEDRRAFDGRELQTTGVFFYDHLQFFSARRAQLLHPWPTWPALPPGGVSGTTPPPDRSEEHTFETRYTPNPMPVVRHHFDLLADFMATAKARGARAVILESPENPHYRHLKGAMHDEYARRLRDLAEELGGEYWDLSREVGARRRDFEDAIHIGAPETRKRFEEVFLRRVGQTLAEIVIAEPRRGGRARAAPSASRDGD